MMEFFHFSFNIERVQENQSFDIKGTEWTPYQEILTWDGTQYSVCSWQHLIKSSSDLVDLFSCTEISFLTVFSCDL